MLDQAVGEIERVVAARRRCRARAPAARCRRACRRRGAPASRAADRAVRHLSSILNPSCVSGAALVWRGSLVASSPPPARLLPNKEMDQAQGAIDAARAAGAERYAANEFDAATAALKKANDAVAARLPPGAEPRAREPRAGAERRARRRRQPRQAARRRRTVDGRSRRRSSRRCAPGSPARRAHARRELAATAQQVVTQATGELQKAGAAMQAEDYVGAQSAVDRRRKSASQKVVPAIAGSPPAAQSTRRPKVGTSDQKTIQCPSMTISAQPVR